jgi:formylglycine-generating enzyme required for sulfatase activity
VWKSGLEANCRAWEAAPTVSKDDALLMGFALRQSQEWMEKRGNDLPEALRQFINSSGKIDLERREADERLEVLRIKTEEELARLLAEKEAREQRERADAEARARREAEWSATRERMRAQSLRAVVGVLLVAIAAGLAWSNRAYLKALAAMVADTVWYKVLTAEAEHALQPGQSFKECFDCGEMVVVPGGAFMMGSPKEEKDHESVEEPQHKVSIKRFAVSRFEVTFEEWDACVTLGGCAFEPSDQGWGRGTRPVMDVSWDDAQQYVAWLSGRTGKTYRLLSEAEWEYVARGGTTTTYSWGDNIGKGNANCDGCGSQWDKRQTAPVGSFKPNAFGLYDMHGNVFQWVEDPWHGSYEGAPTDGSPWVEHGDMSGRVVRGGSWNDYPQFLRAAFRSWYTSDDRYNVIGFRLARTLNP